MASEVDSKLESGWDPEPVDESSDPARTPSSRPTRPPVVAFTAESIPKPASLHVSPAQAHLDVREGFLFLHADGTSSLHVIAEMTGIALDEVKRAFLKLQSKGMIEIDGDHDPLESERPTVTPPPMTRLVES